MSMVYISVSVANSFVNLPTTVDDGHRSFEEMARFIYCLLLKINKAPSLPLVEKWEKYVKPNNARFSATYEKDFLSGTRKKTALDKVGSQELPTEFRGDARRFHEELVTCFLPTVASRSLLRQGVSCLCPAILVSVDDIALFWLFKELMDGFLEKCCPEGAKLKRAGLNTSHLCRKSGSWCGRP